MKKILYIATVAILGYSAANSLNYIPLINNTNIVNDNNNTVTTSQEFTTENLLSKDETSQAFENPMLYKGRSIIIGGKLKVDPQETGNGYVFQAWNDPVHSERHFVVHYSNHQDLKANDYFIVKAVVVGTDNIINTGNYPIKVIDLKASELTKSDYENAISPAKTKVDVNKKVKHGKVDITFKTIEFSEKETRVALQINNRSSDNFHFDDFDSSLRINKKNYKPQLNFEAPYDTIDTYLKKGKHSSGYIVFPPLENYNGRKARLQLYGRNYSTKSTNQFKWYVDIPK